MKERTGRAVVWGVLLLAFAVRGVVPLAAALVTADPQSHHAPDTKSYVALSDELGRSGRFERGGRPELMRTPGYPVFLLLGRLADPAEPVTVALQVMLNCVTVWLVYQIARRLFEREAVALLAALLYALEPLSVVYSSLLLTETLYTFLLSLSLLFLVRYLARVRGWDVVGCALSMVASAYVRPIGYGLVLLVAFCLLYRAALSKPKSRRRLAHAFLFLAVSVTLVGGWQVRNAARTGYWGFSSVADVNLYFYQGASVLAAERGQPYYDVQKELGYRDEALYLRSHPGQRTWDRARRYRFMRREGAQIVRSHLALYAQIHLKGMARTMLDPGGFELLKLFGQYPEGGGLLGAVVDEGMWGAAETLYRERPAAFWTNAALGVLLGVTLLLTAVGLLTRDFVENRAAVGVFFIGLYLLVASGGPQATGRFRHPLMPLVCLLAGLGLWRLWRRLFRREHRRRSEVA